MKEKELIDLAESMALEHRSSLAGGDPYKAFSDYDIPLAADDFNNEFDGLIRFKSNEFQVFVNIRDGSTTSKVRARFTCAHELGHFSIGCHNKSIRTGKNVHKSKPGFRSNIQMEREADIFASHFLVPTKKLLKGRQHTKWGAETILDVAKKFGTSVQCAALRCQSALPGNSALILWGKDAVIWQRLNKDWWFDLPKNVIKNSELLITGSATESLLKGSQVPEEGFLSSGTTSSVWFPRIKGWSARNSILVEYAIPLGKYGVLTLLKEDG